MRKQLVMCAAVLALAATQSCSCDSDDNNGLPDIGTGDIGSEPDTGGEDDAGTGDVGGESDAGPDGGDDAGEEPDMPPTGPTTFTGTWSTDFTAPGMQAPSGGRVNDLLMGTGGEVYAGGIFTAVGAVPAANIAEWSGSQWAALADGLPIDVHALTLDAQGNLIAGGRGGGGGGIGIGGSNAIWKWDGTSWTELATVDGDFTTVDALLTLDDGRIVAGGTFTGVAGEDLPHLAVYDGTSWAALDATGAPDGAVYALEETPDGFCAGGDFSTIGGLDSPYIACYATGWQAYAGLPGSVATIEYTSTGELFVGGTLTFTIDPNTGEYQAGIARWTGTAWEPFQGGVDGGFINEVRSIQEGRDGHIYVGGTFKLIGKGQQDLAVNHFAKWDGTQWATVGDGVENTVGVVLGTEVGINDTLFDGTTLIAGGLFSHAGSASAHNIATWNGTDWAALVDPNGAYLGLGGLANALVAHDGGVLAAGYFEHAGGLPAQNVALLKDGSWTTVGQGLNDVAFTAATDGESVYVGGSFFELPVTGASFLARLEQGVWKGLGTGLDGLVTEIYPVGDALYVGGDFTKSGTLVVNHVAKWENETWSALGSGLNGRVSDLHIGPDGSLYAGGIFEANGAGTPLGYIARFDGTEWVDVGGGLDGRVAVIETYGDKLLVAGTFGLAGTTEAHSMALWDGTNWEPIAGGITPIQEGLPATVSQLIPWGTGFFVGGTFQMLGEQVVNYIAYWNGEEWLSLGEGLADLPEDFIVVGDSVYVSGSFTAAGGKPSYGIARFDMVLPD